MHWFEKLHVVPPLDVGFEKATCVKWWQKKLYLLSPATNGFVGAGRIKMDGTHMFALFLGGEDGSINIRGTPPQAYRRHVVGHPSSDCSEASTGVLQMGLNREARIVPFASGNKQNKPNNYLSSPFKRSFTRNGTRAFETNAGATSKIATFALGEIALSPWSGHLDWPKSNP